MKSEAPIVSVITPTYNQERYIVDCIKSVQQQTFTDWEMLIVNDGSTDNTLKIVESYVKGDDRIKLFDQKNVGIFRLAETYNFALSKARGKYIAILEGDDIWNTDRLACQVPLMENNPDVVLSWAKATFIKDDDMNIVYKIHPAVIDHKNFNDYNNIPVGSILNQMYLENCMPPLTFLIRKDILIDIGGFIQPPGLPLLDFPTILELSLKGRFYFQDRILGMQRIYMTSVTKTYSVTAIKAYVDYALNHYESLNEKIKKQLRLKKDDIDAFYKNYFQIVYACSGRYRLIRRDFKGAREHYAKAIFYPGFKNWAWRLRSGIGYIFSFLKTDIEWLARLLGKPTY